MDKVELAVDDLLLDHSNPRIGLVTSQSEALKAIIDLDVRHFKTMMESIKEHGLDPGDSFYVIEEDGFEDYVVVDGNRRLAALKVLLEPNLMVGAGVEETVKARLTKVARGFDVKTVGTLPCVLFDSRVDADAWILRRHGRGMDGEARIHWGTLEIQRFQKDRSVLDVIEFVGKNSTFSDERWAAIQSAVEKKSSALKRFLDSKPLKSMLGLGVETDEGQKVPTFTSTPEQALGVLGQVFEDIADDAIDTRSHNTAKQIEEYLDELPKGVKPAKLGAKPTKFKDAKVEGGKRPRQAQAAVAKPAKKAAVKPPRLFLAPRRVQFALPPDAKGERLVHEASKLRLKDFPLSAAFVLRAFLEHTLKGYMQAHRMSEVNKKGTALDLKQRAEQVIDHLVAAKTATANDLRGARRTMTVSTDPASIQSLNDYHHNKYQIPTGDALRSAWDSCEALFVAVYGKPK